jgi:hypothetical protein
MHLQPSVRLALVLLTAAACGRNGEGASTFSGGPGPGSSDSTSTSGSSSDTSSSASTGSSSSSSGELSTGGAVSSTGSFDVGVPPDFEPPGPAGCQGKIDFLFVISNSPLMDDVHPQVYGALPDFIAKIQTEFAEFDTHIMVTDTDAFWYQDDCSVCGPGCDPGGEPPLCGAELDACDSAIGAGTVFPSGSDSSARRCELAAGRYITSDDPDPIEAFLCIARVGSKGGGEARTADAMVAAISPALLGTHPYVTGCNQGFLRDDALLVVTLIANQRDEFSSGPAEAWRDALMDAKHQDGEAFQLLVITSDFDVVDGLCGEYSANKNRLRTFVELVPHGKIGSICAESLGPFFDEAVAEVVERCESFVPPQ